MSSLFLLAFGAFFFFISNISFPDNEVIDLVTMEERNIHIAWGCWILSIFISAYIYFSRISAGRYAVTSRRVIERHGILANQTKEIRIKNIAATYLRQSVLQRILGVGNLEIASASEDAQDVNFIKIRGPVCVKEIIVNQQTKEK